MFDTNHHMHYTQIIKEIGFMSLFVCFILKPLAIAARPYDLKYKSNSGKAKHIKFKVYILWSSLGDNRLNPFFNHRIVFNST